MALPVLIHFFSRKQRDVVRWAAMEFLLASNAPRRRFLKLRTCCSCCSASRLFSSSSPPWPGPCFHGLDRLIGTARPRSRYWTIPWPPPARPAPAPSLTTKWTKRPNSSANSTPPTWSAYCSHPRRPNRLTDSPQSADSGNQDALISRLRQLAPGEGAADIPKALQTAIKSTPAAKDVTRYITVISDGRAYGWRADANAEWASIFNLAKRAIPRPFCGPTWLRAMPGRFPIWLSRNWPPPAPLPPSASPSP